MLSLHHPEIVNYLSDAGPGLWPVRTDDGLTLAIKGSADLAFAAKHKKALKFHFYRLEAFGQSAVGIITAIYDRNDAPAIIQTICTDEVMRQVVAEMIQLETIGIHFFDLHSSELAGGKWRLSSGSDALKLIEACSVDVEAHQVLEFYVALRNRFSDPTDDGIVVDATLFEESLPSDVTVIHIVEDSFRSRKPEGTGLYQSNLLGDIAPGDANEAEIARLLTRVYAPARIIVNPEIAKGKEFCDVLAIGSVEAIAVHAKSAVREARRFNEEASRRDSRLDKHFQKALAQAKGAERAFYLLKRAVAFDGEVLDITPETRLLVHVIILYDKSPSLLAAWSAELAAFASELTPVVVLDMTEFVNLLNMNRDRDLFVNALFALADDFQRRKSIGEYTFTKGRVAIH